MDTVRLLVLAGLVSAAFGLSATEDFFWLPKSTRDYLKRGLMNFLRFTGRIIGDTSSHSQIKEAQKLMMIQTKREVKFPCSLEGGSSPEVPDSVDRLRPGDIRVVAAFGDSLTAAFGAAAASLIGVAVQNRGLSWSIGGQGTWDEYLTLPNLLKAYNPELMGQSVGDSHSFEKKAQFNVAEAAAMTHDMPYMAKHLVRRIIADSRVNLTTDWKMVTLMIGSNDYCLDMCYYNVDKYTARRKKMLIKTMDILMENLPRTFVNLVISPNVGELLPKVKGQNICWVTQRLECPCVLGPAFRRNIKNYQKKISESQQIEMDVASMAKYQRKDFAVVAQPFLLNLELPTLHNGSIDFSYFSRDCFHLSQKSSARAANALWNNLFEPVGNKSKNWDKEFKVFKCPDPDHPYIYTPGNSKTKT